MELIPRMTEEEWAHVRQEIRDRYYVPDQNARQPKRRPTTPFRKNHCTLRQVPRNQNQNRSEMHLSRNSAEPAPE